MARGQTWSEEETKALIQIWSDETISQLLVTTHKNNFVFKLISTKMEAVGFSRTVEQCRIKVKKLRQQYIKIRDVFRKSGSCGEKDKFPWYDDLDGFLSSLPTSSPQHIVESYGETPETPSSLAASDPESTEEDQESEKWDKSTPDIKVEETPTTSYPQDEETGQQKLAVPGAAKRKRKTKTDRFEKVFQSYLVEKRKMDEEESRRMKQESASFENFLRMQQEAEEKRFLLMQEQQRANSQMFFQMMGNFLQAATLQPTAPPTTEQWMPPASSHNPSAQNNIAGAHPTSPAPAQPPQEP